MGLNITKILLIILTFFNASCFNNEAVKAHEINNITKKKIPINSFVKILVTVDILKCIEEKKSKQSRCAKGTYRSVGSGISIGSLGDSSVVITAGHVCSFDPPEYIHEYKISIAAVNTSSHVQDAIIINKVNDSGSIDLCMLLIPGLKTDAVKLSRKEPQVGDRIYALSAPAGIFHPPVVPIFDGVFSGNIRGNKNAVVTIRATGGSSGSGILNTDMELVGILFATHSHFNSITLINSRESTIKFISDSLPFLQHAISIMADPPL